MAIILAAQSGNFNSTSTWTGGVVPSTGDVAVANSYTITITANATCSQIRNDTTGGAYNSGLFTINTGVTLTADIYAGSTTASNGPASVTITINGNIYGGTYTNAYGLIFTGSGNLTVNGSATGGTGNNANGIYSTNVGTITISGSCIGGYGGNGVLQNATGTIIMKRAVGGGYGLNCSSLISATYGAVNNTGTFYVSEIEYGPLGQSPTSGKIRLTDASTNVCLFYRSSSSKKTLIDSSQTSSSLPTASDVRYGASYNGGSSTGTCRVPSPSNVVYGKLVDNTTGTASLSPNDIWAYQTSNINTSGSMGLILNNISTVETTGKQLADCLRGV